MVRGCIPILLLAASFAQEPQKTTNVHPVRGVSIPAELSTTIKAESVHRGDPVVFRTIEPVLIGSGLVMPANSKLAGRIVGAAPRQGDKPSWLVLLVERGEWKNQSVPLHAYISAQISISKLPNQPSQTGDDTTTPINPRRAGRESGRVAAANGVDISSSTRLPQDSRSADQSPTTSGQAVPLKDLSIVRDQDGIAYLFSTHSNVKLPSGTLFVLQNEPATDASGAGTKASPTAPPPAN
jgi:hypothetical protein